MVIVVCACVQNKDTFLVLKRNPHKSIWPLCWDFPGGKVDPGETLLQALKREVQEETHCACEIGEELARMQWDLSGTKKHLLDIHVFSVQLQGTVQLSEEHTELAWLTKKEIEALPLNPYLRQFLHICEKF